MEPRAGRITRSPFEKVLGVLKVVKVLKVILPTADGYCLPASTAPRSRGLRRHFGAGLGDLRFNYLAEFCIGAGAHTHYWDDTAPDIAEALNELI